MSDSGMFIYRGKTKDTEASFHIWVEGFYVIINDRHYILPEGAEFFCESLHKDDFIEVSPETIGQCLGLKDIKGKDIFVGDIVRVPCYGKLRKPRVEEVTAEIWQERNVITFFPFDMYSTNEAGYEPDACEVIGNVYDYPELLEDNKCSYPTSS